MLQRQIDDLFNKPMDRKEFLTHVGYGALLITGVSALLRGLTSFSGDRQQPSSPIDTRASHGFGSRKFGE